MFSYFIVGWSILHLCHHSWCLQSFLSMKHPSFEPTHSLPLQLFALMCVTSLCASIQECFRQALFPLRCLCSYQSSQKMQASETLFGLSEVVWTRAVFLLWHYHCARWARFVPWGNMTLSCAQWLAVEQAMIWETSKRKVLLAITFVVC